MRISEAFGAKILKNFKVKLSTLYGLIRIANCYEEDGEKDSYRYLGTVALLSCVLMFLTKL